MDKVNRYGWSTNTGDSLQTKLVLLRTGQHGKGNDICAAGVWSILKKTCRLRWSITINGVAA